MHVVLFGERRQLDAGRAPAGVLEGAGEGRVAGDLPGEPDGLGVEALLEGDLGALFLAADRLESDVLLERLAAPISASEKSATSSRRKSTKRPSRWKRARSCSAEAVGARSMRGFSGSGSGSGSVSAGRAGASPRASARTPPANSALPSARKKAPKAMAMRAKKEGRSGSDMRRTD